MFFQRIDRALQSAEAAAQPTAERLAGRVSAAGANFAKRSVSAQKKHPWLSWANLSKPLNLWFFCLASTEKAAKVVVGASLVLSFLSTIRPLAEPIAWVTGGFTDACIGVSILGSIGLFFSTLGLAGISTPHPGYVLAFERYLIGRLLMSIPVFISDRLELHRCEAYVNSLTHRIDPSLILRRIAMDGRCQQARDFTVGRWIVEFFLTLYCIRVIYYAHEDLAARIPYNDIFEDPAEFLINRRWRSPKATPPPSAATYGTTAQPTAA
jgi:hypothetical protein